MPPRRAPRGLSSFRIATCPKSSTTAIPLPPPSLGTHYGPAHNGQRAVRAGALAGQARAQVQGGAIRAHRHRTDMLRAVHGDPQVGAERRPEGPQPLVPRAHHVPGRDRRGHRRRQLHARGAQDEGGGAAQGARAGPRDEGEARVRGAPEGRGGGACFRARDGEGEGRERSKEHVGEAGPWTWLAQEPRGCCRCRDDRRSYVKFAHRACTRRSHGADNRRNGHDRIRCHNICPRRYMGLVWHGFKTEGAREKGLIVTVSLSARPYLVLHAPL